MRTLRSALGTVAALALLAAGCLGDEAAGGPSPGASDPCPAGWDAGAPDAAEADAPPAWALPPCERACDRVVSCGVDDCVGWTWATAGALMAPCVAACDDDWPGEVLAAPACEQVAAAVVVAVAELAESCDSAPCEAACTRLGACAVERCPAVDEAAGAQIAADCLPGCDPGDAQWLMGSSCASVIDAISTNDPGFASWCSGEPAVCPGPELCVPYGEKIAGCIVDQCDGNADPYQVGLAAALRDFCLGGADCPTADGVEAVLDEALTCDVAPLDGIGEQAPFNKLCVAGPVSAAELESACLALKACPGTDWVESVDLCMVLFGLRPDAGSRAACLNAATGDCSAVYDCLEGL